MSRLFIRFAATFLTFVIAGSLALVLWMGAEERRQSREQFAAMAKANAELFTSQNYPISPRTADAVSEVLGVDLIFIRTDKGDVVDPPWSERLKPLHMACRFSIEAPGKIFDQYLEYPNIRLMLAETSPGRTLKTDAPKWEIVSWPLRDGYFLALVRPEHGLWNVP